MRQMEHLDDRRALEGRDDVVDPWSSSGQGPGRDGSDRNVLRARSRIIVAGLLALTFAVASAPAISDRLPGARGDRPIDALSDPLGAAPAVVPTGPHTFTSMHDGEPVRWDPCAPIHLVVNTRTAPLGAADMLTESVRSINAATGLELVIDGTTDRTSDDSLVDSDGRALPVIVDWTDPGAVSGLRGTVAGLAGATPVRDRAWYDAGRVMLDGPQLGEIVDRPGGYVSARAVVLHELGHLVGLGHVEDADELMAPKGSADVTDWGPGDREGLAALGGTECRPY